MTAMENSYIPLMIQQIPGMAHLMVDVYQLQITGLQPF